MIPLKIAIDHAPKLLAYILGSIEWEILPCAYKSPIRAVLLEATTKYTIDARNENIPAIIKAAKMKWINPPLCSPNVYSPMAASKLKKAAM